MQFLGKFGKLIYWRPPRELAPPPRGNPLADPRWSQGRSPSLGPFFFIFMQFSVKILPNNRFLPHIQGLAPPVWKILDPPLQHDMYHSLALTAYASVATTRCWHWVGVLKWTSLNMSPPWGVLYSEVPCPGGAELRRSLYSEVPCLGEISGARGPCTMKSRVHSEGAGHEGSIYSEIACLGCPCTVRSNIPWVMAIRPPPPGQTDRHARPKTLPLGGNRPSKRKHPSRTHTTCQPTAPRSHAWGQGSACMPMPSGTRHTPRNDPRPGTHPPHFHEQNDWQMPVKTLPPGNYCSGRQKQWLHEKN